jgi:cyclopropane-fatty-acyl-phospholipid synthase
MSVQTDVARRSIRAMLRRMHAGRLTVVEDGRRAVFGPGGEPHATVEVRSPAFWPALLHGSRGLAEAYVDGLWDSPDVTAVVRVAARNVVLLDDIKRRVALVREPVVRARAAFVRNDRRRSRRDISAHYDLGNDLYELMLDETMMYSSAIFARPDMTLREAQEAKLDRVCAQLALGPDDHVIEIGTGWGGFAIHAARTTGCRVTTTTISREQRALALERVAEAGLSDRVTVLDHDYRDVRGRYDALVSLEMIEAVGWKDFDTFFRCCSDLLKDDGAMLLQAIVVDDRAYEVEKASRSFIRTMIFPNGCLPSQEVIARCVARVTDLRTVDLFDMTASYPETLRRWRAAVEAHAGELDALGYDERFRRLWRLYLCYSEAGFEERRIGDVQLTLAKPRWRRDVSAREWARDERLVERAA